jgi:hypothetical protein
LPRTRKITYLFTSFLFDKIMLIWYKIPHYQCGFYAVSEKMIFPRIRYSFQKRKYVIFLDIGEIPEKGVHESSVWYGRI